jgi:hypothetical protein
MQRQHTLFVHKLGNTPVPLSPQELAKGGRVTISSKHLSLCVLLLMLVNSQVRTPAVLVVYA